MATADYSRDPSGIPPSAPSVGAAPDASGLLRRNLDRLAARRDWQLLWRSMASALMYGTGAAALAVLAYRFYLINGEWWMIAILIAAAAAIGFRNGRIARSGAFDAALDADRALGMQEELSSALAFSDPSAVRQRRAATEQRGWSWTTLPLRLRAVLLPRVAYDTVPSSAPTHLVPALVVDAASRSNTLNPRQVYPLRFDLTHKLLIVFALLLAIFCFMPNVPWFLSAAQKTTNVVLQKEGEKLVAAAKEIRQEEKKETEAKRMAKRVESLGKKMQRGRMTKKEALADLGQLKKDLEKVSKKEKQSQGAGMAEAFKQMMQEKMESRDGQELQEAIKEGDQEKVAKKVDQIADKLEKNQMSEEEKRKAANDMQKMAQALKKQGGEKAEEMAKQLEQAAQAMQQQQGQQGKQQQNQQGQQNQSGQQGKQGKGQQQQQSQGAGEAPNALRKLAKSMREMGSMPNGMPGSSKNLQDLMDKIQDAEDQTGSNGDQEGKNGKPCDTCGKSHKPGGT